MKSKNKKKLALLVLMFSMISTKGISYCKEYTIENLHLEKSNYEKDFLLKNGLKDIKDIPEKNINLYFDGIEKIKNEYFKNNPNLIKRIFKTRDPAGYLPHGVKRNSYTGDVYVTHDKTWKNGDYFGHAGLGGYEVESVFELFPGKGLVLSKGSYGHDRWSDCKTGGRYEVRGATTINYDGAADYGYWKLQQGLSYSLWGDGSDSDYCSGFVYRAWKSEGFDLSNGNFFKPCIAPWDLSNDDDTYRVQSFGD